MNKLITFIYFIFTLSIVYSIKEQGDKECSTLKDSEQILSTGFCQNKEYGYRFIQLGSSSTISPCNSESDTLTWGFQKSINGTFKLNQCITKLGNHIYYTAGDDCGSIGEKGNGVTTLEISSGNYLFYTSCVKNRNSDIVTFSYVIGSESFAYDQVINNIKNLCLDTGNEFLLYSSWTDSTTTADSIINKDCIQLN